MAVRPGSVVAAVALSSMFPFVLSGCAGDPGTATDEQRLVYCLAQGRERSVAEAAIRLGLASRSEHADHLVVAEGDILVTSWRGADFARACDAVMAANRNEAPVSGTPGWLATVLATVNALGLLLVGAFVTLVTGSLRETGTRRRAAAGHLRAASQSFSSVFEAYVDAQVVSNAAAPAPQTVRERRRELESALLAAQAVHKSSPDLEEASRRLREELGESALRDWELDDDKETEVHKLHTSRTELTEEIEGVNKWLERSLLSRLGGGA
jgi:hypothetical protein